ncbi:NAD(P)(+) transhydrogenase (Re/Si-specific) subunit alpha, partial [Bordetella avium]
MRIGIPKETRDGETRVAATPETVKKYVTVGHAVVVEQGAGERARYRDEDYAAAGASLTDRAAALGSELVLKVRAPDADELRLMRRGAVLVGMLDPFDAAGLARIAAAGLTAFALEIG